MLHLRKILYIDFSNIISILDCLFPLMLDLQIFNIYIINNIRYFLFFLILCVEKWVNGSKYSLFSMLPKSNYTLLWTTLGLKIFYCIKNIERNMKNINSYNIISVTEIFFLLSKSDYILEIKYFLLLIGPMF